MKTNRIYSFLGILFALMVFSGTVWADVFTHEFTSTETAGSKTWSSVSWTLSMSGGQTDTYSSTQGAKYGTNKNTCTSVGFSTSGLSGTISSVTIEASRGSQLVGTLAVSVDNNAYTLSSGNTALTTANAANVFTGNKKGALNISWTKSSGKGAFYLKKIVVKYGYKITFNCNGASSGCPSNISDTTKLPNPLPSALTKSGYTFGGWYTNEGCTTAASAGASITANTTLYAKWTADASCDADPTIGTASLNGSFNSGGVTSLTNTVSFSCASITPGTNCAVEASNYGFIWYSGASADKKHGDGGVNELTVTTAYSSGSFTKTISSALTVDQQYTFRAWATNDKPGTVHSTEVSFTPRSVAFNPNGGSAVSTKYIKSGGTITNPGAPATPKTGYNFDSWRTDAGLGTAVNWSSAINSSTTYYAKWNPNNYTIMLNDGVGSGGSGSVTATFDANTNLTSSVAVPTLTDYIFGGYWTGDNGTGTQIIDANGAFIASAGGGSTYTDASKNWKYANDITLKAKWTEHTYTNYRTKCCTDLGAIDGEATLTQGGNSVTISGWSDVANVGTYTVKLYKKNGASWDLVSGSTSGGSAGTQGTRTGITSGSKSVTYTGLVVESEYKFTIQAIAGSAAYCDGVETAVTEINSTDVSSTPFKFRYSIYIDNGSNSGWAHHYIEPTGNTDEGSVSITLGAHVDYYQFKIAGGFSGWWGQSGSSKIPANTQWTLNSDQNVRLETGAGGAYVFTVDYSGTTNPKVTVTFPSADQGSGYKIYFDKSVIADWGSTLKYRIGNNTHNQNQNFTLVPGTDNFYVTTTPSYGSMDAWQIANNVAWTPGNPGEYDAAHGIYNYYHNGDANNITRATVYQDYAVDEDITIVPSSKHNTENSCDFWDVSKTSGMLTHTATITTPSHGTINIAYTDVSGTSQPTNTSTVADLAHRTILTITATPATGYSLTSLTVDGDDFTSGDEFILNDDATIEATFTAQTSTVTLDNNDATSGSQQTVTATYDATMPLVTTAVGTPAVAAISRTGYTFNGWWDNTSGGNQYYTYNSGTGVIASARTWDKTGAQTLKAQWTVNQYTLTWDLQGGTVTTAGTGAAAAATGTPSSSQDYGTALTAPIVTKTGYNFNVWSPSVAGTMPAANATYTASWTAQVYDITYKDQGDNAYSGNATAGVPTGAPTTHTYGSATALVNGVKDGYRFDGWFTDPSCTVSAGSSIGATAMTADFTLYAKWTQVYTVTWYVNGDEWTSGVVEGNTHVPGGSKVSALPTAPTSSDCDDSKVFVGWKAAEIDGTSAGDPGGIFTTQGTSPTINANMDFYAVFADRSGGDNILVTNVSELTAGTKVYIYAATSDVPAFTGVAKAYDSEVSANNVRAVSGSVSSNKLTPSDGACAYTIGEVTVSATKYYTFNDGTNYLRATGTDKNYLVGAAELGDDEKGLFSVSITAGVFSITCKNTSVRGVMQFNKNADTGDYTKALFACYSSASQTNVQLFKKTPYTYSNYVTSCASCDADATYTNTTPTVSEIGCTTATLTMEDGLATLGAAGCNISDYGFVIGTSDNPAIGGSGVTKLQVGTTNPTTGEDFSYDATDLTKGTHYYIRAYAINRHGTAYSTNSQNFWTKDVSSIAITTAPTKTNYIVGETFDATGMVVTATMASGSTENVTSDVTYSTDALTAGTNKDFAIEYTLCETDKSVNQKINVYTLSVSEGTNPSYGSYSVEGAVITVTPNAQKTFTLVPTNAEIRDNGNGTYTVINPTGNVTVVINYRDAVQVKVYYRVDGVEVTGLTQDVYESSQTTLPTASALASAMAAQSMELPDELYPNFLGWSETEFGAQTADPTLVTGTPTINASKSFYAVYSNVNKIRIDESVITGTSYPGSEQTATVSSKDFKYYTVIKQSANLQFKKASNTSYIYNNTPISNIVKIEVGANDGTTYSDAVPVYAGSAANTISGSALVDEDTYRDRYVYLFPSSTQYFIVKGNNDYLYQVDYIDVYYSSSTAYYMTQFCTRYDITGASTSGTTVIVNGKTGGTLTSSHNALCEGKSLTLSASVNTQYSFGEWKIIKTGVEPEVDVTSTLLGANKTSMTPPAFSMPGYDITVSATISEKTATAWSWTYNSSAIPNPMTLYVGEVKQLDVTYTPDASQLVTAQKNYTVTKESSVAEVAKAGEYYKMRGAAGVTEETSTTVTFSLNSLSQVVNVTVKPLPSARFEDNVHNAISTTVTATVTDGVVALTQKTPTHADISPAPATGNACEKNHLHLVGWIDGEWEPYINYINGGSRPSDSDITSATGYFYLPNADIDLSAKGGHTYYAVWGKADE